jgi:hypothetical protein
MQFTNTRFLSRLALAAATAMLLASCGIVDDTVYPDMGSATGATKDMVVIERVAGLGTEPVAQN